MKEWAFSTPRSSAVVAVTERRGTRALLGPLALGVWQWVLAFPPPLLSSGGPVAPLRPAAPPAEAQATLHHLKCCFPKGPSQQLWRLLLSKGNPFLIFPTRDFIPV